jgi:hypothetical protein
MLYLKGERDTYFGLNKFILYCDPSGKKVALAIFDPQGWGNQITTMHANSIEVDGKLMHLTDDMIVGPMDFTGARDQLVGLLSSCKSSGPTATLRRQ